jgi:hypothetical protein
MKGTNVLVTGERLPAARKDELDPCEYFPQEANAVTRGETSMRVEIATDHGGFNLKEDLAAQIRIEGHEVVDFRAYDLVVAPHQTVERVEL